MTIQTKLAINTPGDPYEQEADRVAEQVTRIPESSDAIFAVSGGVPGVQRKCACGGSCDKCQEEPGHEHDRLGMKPAGSSASARTAVPPIVHEVLRAPGQPLDRAALALMEPRFGQDFSRVRVHVDSQAGASARDIGALAYTVGRDIVFAQGQFAPHTASGRRLLAHELTHTVQQGESAANFAGQSVRPIVQPMLQRQPSPNPRVPETPPLENMPPKVEGGEKPPAATESPCESPSDIPLPCSPTGLADADFLKTGAPIDAVGFTQPLIKKGFSTPDVLTKPASKSKVVIQKTEAKPAPCESFFSKAGTFSRTISLDASKPEERANAERCRGSSYQKEFTITPDGEKKITEAEMEHCTDYKRAFDISIGCFAKVVNDLARKKTEFPSQDAAVDAVTKRAGRKPDTWSARYVELLDKSQERDLKGWHRAAKPIGPGVELVPDKHDRCKSRVPTEINEKSFPKVGKYPSSDVIQ